MIVNLHLAGEVEAYMFVELEISLHLNQSYTNLLGFPQSILQ